MVRLVALLVLVAGIAASPAVRAAAPDNSVLGPSFTCAPGQDPIAQLICASPDLSRIDLIFVQAFQALSQQSDAAGRQRLKLEEIAFHSQVLSQCRIPPTAASITSLPPSTTECVSKAYMAQREAWLHRLSPAALEEASRPIEEHVKAQQDLQALGFLPAKPPADGNYGPATRAAITAWQQANRYAANGFISGQQIKALEQGVGGTKCSGCASSASPAPKPAVDKLAEQNQIEDADLVDYSIQVHDWKTYWVSDRDTTDGDYVCVPAVQFTVKNIGSDDLSHNSSAVVFSANFLNQSEKSTMGSGTDLEPSVPPGFSAKVVIKSYTGFRDREPEYCSVGGRLPETSVTVKLNRTTRGVQLHENVILGQSAVGRRVLIESMGRFQILP